MDIVEYLKSSEGKIPVTGGVAQLLRDGGFRHAFPPATPRGVLTYGEGWTSDLAALIERGAPIREVGVRGTGRWHLDVASA